MKVVLFCGGMGMRLRDYSESLPKPMVNIGYRPILWHVMKYYAHYGHRDFILCLGYKGDVIKDYFLNYNECLSNDFVLAGGGKVIRLMNSDIDNWSVTFVDTGQHSNIGQRLKAVEKHLAGEEIFLANYSDGLTDLVLPDYIDRFQKSNKIASFLAVKPNHSFHVVEIDNEESVRSIQHLKDAGIWMNGGFFIFRKEIFGHIEDGEELVNEPFRKLIEKGELIAHKHTGFWASMDTFKDKQFLDNVFSQGEAPWEVWKRHRGK